MSTTLTFSSRSERSSSSSGCRSPSCGEKKQWGKASSVEKKKQGRKASSAEKTEKRKGSAGEKTGEKTSFNSQEKKEGKKMSGAEKSQKWSQKGFKEVTASAGGQRQTKQ